MHLFKFLLVQLLSWLVILVFTKTLYSLLPNVWSFVWLQAVLATFCAFNLRQPYWWLPIHLLFSPAAFAMLTLDVPAESYLGILVLLILVFWGTVKGDVPLFLSSTQVIEAVAEIVAEENAIHFADLGAGVGSVAIPIAKNFPHLVVDAWERAPLPYCILRWRGRLLANLHSQRSNFWACHLQQYDVVFVFLSPAAMPELGNKARQEMHSGALLVSSSFPIITWEPERIQQLEDPRKTTLYFYRLP